ncbi:hypothetical protein J2S17_001440 [Cytobacillus purgationiresistens]|uniref:Uncharacterized protein n=1 Tax=Cytobacillus purgationiresistens TaxID=863449 RepID=A0ABU0AFD3_9BACI|nr:hypothetical protein [Cytobacillus purgationiresistens]
MIDQSIAVSQGRDVVEKLEEFNKVFRYIGDPEEGHALSSHLDES